MKSISMKQHSDIEDSRKRIKTLTNQVKTSQKTIDSHNISNYTLRKSHSKNSSSQISSTRSSACHKYINNTTQIFQRFYLNQQTNYYKKIKKYLDGQWQTHKTILIERLNYLPNLQNGVQTKNYSEIQMQIILEWRKNPILYHIRSYWYQYILQKQLKNIQQFIQQYNLFKDFLGEIAYLYFKTIFKNHRSCKDQRLIQDRLSQKTSHFIIAHTNSWNMVCNKQIIPNLKQKLQEKYISHIQVNKFTMEQLQIKTIAVDYKAEQNQMPKTTTQIQLFVNQNKTLSKIKLLKQIRDQMNIEIQKRQKQLIKQGFLKDIKILDKDDFVDCLVYCVIKGDISLQKLGISIKYLQNLLGSQVSNILSKFKCDPYLADLEVVYDFLLQKFKSKNKLISQTLITKQSTHQNTTSQYSFLK